MKVVKTTDRNKVLFRMATSLFSDKFGLTNKQVEEGMEKVTAIWIKFSLEKVGCDK
jgi:hypothetical protein